MAKNQSHRPILLFTLFVFLLLGTSVKSRDAPQETEMVKMHEEWMIKHGRVYNSPEEKENRFKIFKENVERINAHNQVEGRTYDKAVNKFSDMTSEEFKTKYTRLAKRSQASPSKGSYLKPTLKHSDVPVSVDWRKEGAVTPVKEQGDCQFYQGWAFAVVAAVEGIHKLKGPTHKLISLSEQELLDCINEHYAPLGETFQWIVDNKCLKTDEAYPYRPNNCVGECDKNASSYDAATISSYDWVPVDDEKALEQIVAQQPVSVGITVEKSNIESYDGGVYTGKCVGPTLPYIDVTIVGYGKDENGTSYWLMKNSWGVGWGEEGYIRIPKDVPPKEDSCGMIENAWYPIIE